MAINNKAEEKYQAESERRYQYVRRRGKSE
jgi:hypothetical protein